jgi:hypothetical protein
MSKVFGFAGKDSEFFFYVLKFHAFFCFVFSAELYV